MRIQYILTAIISFFSWIFAIVPNAYAQNATLHPVCQTIMSANLRQFNHVRIKKTWQENKSTGDIVLYSQFRTADYFADALVISATDQDVTIEIPPLPDRGVPYYFSVALLEENGQFDLICDNLAINIPPHSIMKAGWLDMLQSQKNLIEKANLLAQINDAEVFPRDVIALQNQAADDAASAYYFANTDAQFVMDVAAARLKKFGVDLDVVANATQELRQFINSRTSQRGKLNLPLPKHGLSPNMPLRLKIELASLSLPNTIMHQLQRPESHDRIQMSALDGDNWAQSICPANGAELEELSTLAATGAPLNDTNTGLTLAAAQVATQVAATLLASRIGGPKAGKIASDQVGYAYTYYSLVKKFHAGMLPYIFIEVDAKKSNYPVFEDSALSPDVEFTKINLTTSSEGWDMLGAAVELGIAGFGAAGGKTMAQSAYAKHLNSLKALGKSSPHFKPIISDNIDTMLGGLDSAALGLAYGASGANYKFPPIRCVTDITEPKWSEISLLGGLAFKQKYPDNNKVFTAIAAGEHPYQILPKITYLKDIPQPAPLLYLEVPEIKVEITGPKTIKVGEIENYRFSVENLDPKADTEAELELITDFPVEFNKVGQNQFVLDASKMKTDEFINGPCRDRLMVITASLNGEFLENSIAGERVYTKDVYLQRDEDNEDCGEEEEYIEGLVLAPSPNNDLLQTPLDRGFGCLFSGVNSKYVWQGQLMMGIAQFCHEYMPGNYATTPNKYGFDLNWYGDEIQFVYRGRRYLDIKDNIFLYANTPPNPAPPMDMFRQLEHGAQILERNPVIYERIGPTHTTLWFQANYAIKHRNIYYFMDEFLTEGGLNFFWRVPYCDIHCRRNEETLPPIPYPEDDEIVKEPDQDPSKNEPDGEKGNKIAFELDKDPSPVEPTQNDPDKPIQPGFGAAPQNAPYYTGYLVLGESGMKVSLQYIEGSERASGQFTIISKNKNDCIQLAKQVTIINEVCNKISENNSHMQSFSAAQMQVDLTRNEFLGSFASDDQMIEIDGKLRISRNKTGVLFINPNGGRRGTFILQSSGEMYQRIENNLPQ